MAQATHPGGAFHDAFYKFVHLADTASVATALRELTTPPSGSALLGSILVAHEGINGMLAGSAEALDAFRHALATDPRFGGHFADIVYKRSPCITQAFKRMKVHEKAEIVPLGIPGIDATKQTGINVSPADWRRLIDDKDVLLIDNRNSFEFRLGQFRNAVNPEVTNFRDFPAYVLANINTWKAEGKKVAMYCTGGIRCEKTSAWMLDLGMTVYQLEGGILNYFEKMPDAEKDWQGECFVFDNRIALDTKLQETPTTLDDVYGSGSDDDAWRLRRAKLLDSSS